MGGHRKDAIQTWLYSRKYYGLLTIIVFNVDNGCVIGYNDGVTTVQLY